MIDLICKQCGGEIKEVDCAMRCVVCGLEVKELMCEVCHDTFTAEDNVTYCCYLCGRCGFCEECSSPGCHDCGPPALLCERLVPKFGV